MSLPAELKENIFKKVIDVMLIGIDTQALEHYELTDISQFVLKRTEELESETQARTLYRELADKWPVFGILLEDEENRVHELVESEISEGAANLLQHGKVDEALALVKTATN